jgi:hypothetical protein
VAIVSQKGMISTHVQQEPTEMVKFNDIIQGIFVKITLWHSLEIGG